MLRTIGVESTEALFADLPRSHRLPQGLDLPPGRSEREVRRHMTALAARNRPLHERPCFLGAGLYRHTIPAAVRAVLAKPEFFTAYTPYQPELSQGTLRAMLEYQTYVTRLTGMEVSNASLYDGPTAVAEAVLMGMRLTQAREVWVSAALHPEYRAVLITYLRPLGIHPRTIPLAGTRTDLDAVAGEIGSESVLVIQSPNFLGSREEMALFARARRVPGAFVILAVTEAYSLALEPRPADLEVDAVAGSGQSFGNPLSMGGPHFGFLATRQANIRQMPGRIAGRTLDRHGHEGVVLTFQAREQHIRRERAASNICTNQALNALAATVFLRSFGLAGLCELAGECAALTDLFLREAARLPEVELLTADPFNEVTVRIGDPAARARLARAGFVAGLPLDALLPEFTGCLLLAFTEENTRDEVELLLASLAGSPRPRAPAAPAVPARLRFRQDREQWPSRSETEVMRHFHRLARQNYCVDQGLYPLGSCTMKYNPRLNEELAALPGFSELHPCQPVEEIQGALALQAELERALSTITGLPAFTLQPAAGAHGELTALLIARAFYRHSGHPERTRVLVPDSAHGTNPASATMCGLEVVTIPSDARGNLDLAALRRQLDERVAVLMLTNPNTLGLFEEQILEVQEAVHQAGALLYYDGANLNAILGQIRPGDMGFDLLHLNLHKTFSTPHGGGGPGSGPVGVRADLIPFLPAPRITRSDGGRFALDPGDGRSIGRVKGGFGNFAMHVRALAYILRLGADGLARASAMAVLNANYLLARLRDLFPPAYPRRCMHELVLSARALKKETGLSAMDIAKRLIDFGVHPPTVYFPLIVPEALMIEPTETVSLAELDAFCDAMAAIAREAHSDPQLLHEAPVTTPFSRFDDVRAVRQPLLTTD